MGSNCHYIPTTLVVVSTAILFMAIISLSTLIGATRVNLARGRPATQISSTWGGWPSYGVDGVKETNFFTWRCTHTNSEALTWWMVDLEQDYVISGAEITTRQHHADRLADFSLEISTQHPSNLPGYPGSTTAQVCFHSPTMIPSSATYYYPCSSPILGRYLRVVKYKHSPLSLCEFEAYENQPWRIEKVDPNGFPDILEEVVTGSSALIECGRLCVRYTGRPCKYIQFERTNGTCRLLKGFQPTDQQLNPEWELYEMKD